MNKNLLLLVVFIFMIACSASFNTPEKQSSYLENMETIYEEAVEAEQKAKEDFGDMSKVHVLARRKTNKIKKENFIKLEEYLRLYGHPTKSEHGDNVVAIPEDIFTAYGPKEKYYKKYFKYFYTAWQSNDLSDYRFARYLQILHRFQHGDRLKLENPYRLEHEIDALLKVLNVEALSNYN